MTISVNSIYKDFGDRPVLKDVNLFCPAGEITALVGPNGAGKTTLFKIMLGLLRADSGEVDPSNSSLLGGIVEKPAVYPYLSAEENLKVFARVGGRKLNKIEIHDLLDQVGLPTDRKDPSRNFSMGMKQRLGIAVALLSDPKALILDEPFTGLDPMGIRDLSQLLRDLAENRGMAVLVSSHFIDQLVRFCDHIHLIREGEIIAGGKVAELTRKMTTAYRLTGMGLKNSETLKGLGVSVRNHSTLVPANLVAAHELLKKLAAEGLFPDSCHPELDLQIVLDQ